MIILQTLALTSPKQKTEIEDLQAKAILKAPLSGETTVDNDMVGNILKSATLLDSRRVSFAHSSQVGTVEIDHQLGHYHTLTTTGPITLTFNNFPGTGGSPVFGFVRVEILIQDISHTVTLGPEVITGAQFIDGYVSGGTIGVDPGVITFAEAGSYIFEFTSIDSTTYTIHDMTRGPVTPSSGLQNVVEDPTPQLGGALDVQGFAINTSTVDADITLTPNGTGDIVLGTMTIDGDQPVGAAQDTYMLAYDNASGLVALTPPGAGVPHYKSYTASTTSSGSGTFYVGGYYDAPATDATLTMGGTETQVYGNADNAYAAHAFIVASGAGGGTDLVLTVTGTSITDAGVRTPADSEILIGPGGVFTGYANTVTTDQYIETDKKWLGPVTYTLTGTAGAFTFNYGFCKYEDFGNRGFTVTDFESVGYAVANETGLDIELLHHHETAFVYNATTFVPNATPLVSLVTDHAAFDEVDAGTNYAYKRAGLSSVIDGAASEGTIIRITTAVNNSMAYMDFHLGVSFNGN